MTGLFTPNAPVGNSDLAAAVLTDDNRLIVMVIAAVALAALVVAQILVRQVLAADEGTDSMKKIAAAVQEGANAYLGGSCALGIFAVVVFFLLFLLPADDWSQRACSVRLLPRRRPLLGRHRLHRHAPGRSRQRPCRRRRPRGDPRRRRPRQGPHRGGPQGDEDRLPHRWRGRHVHRRPRPARRLLRRARLRRRRTQGPGGLRPRRSPHRDVHARGRRHLHQGRRRGRRPGRQGRAGHSGGRPA